MKKPRTDRKLTLTAETIRHLKGLTTRELGRVHGGESGACSGNGDCTTTLTDQHV